MSESGGMRTPEIKTKKKGLLSNLSIVWLVPVVALLGALGLALDSYSNRDVPIEIRFTEATGIEPGKTEIKFRELPVGVVTELDYTDDLKTVVVKANIHKDMSKYLDAETEFWLVTAKVSTSGISGLSTLLSGAYINVEWDAEQGERAREFTALQDPPVILPGAQGIEIRLSTPNTGSVSVGAPILHKGVKMGSVEAVDYNPGSDTVLITAFIDDPYGKLINTGTRFWNASGVSLELNDEGIALHVGSLASLLQGGIQFDTTISGGEPIENLAVFDLYPSEAHAKESLLDENLRATVHLSSAFEGSLKGLKEGSDVLFRGLKVGQVQTLSAVTIVNDQGDPDIRMLASYTVQPTRLGLEDVATSDETLDLLEGMVARTGLRARLAANSLFSGGLHIELYEDSEAEPAVLQRDVEPYPVLPTTPTPPETLAVAAEGVLERVSALPIEEIMDRTIKLLTGIDAIVADQNTKAIPKDVRELLESVNTVAASDGIQNLPADLQGAMHSVNDILRRFDESDGVESIVGALEDVRAAAANISTASNGLPDLLGDIDAFVENANDLPLANAVESADAVLQSVNEFLSNPDMESVPGALSGALEQANLTLEELRKGGAVDSLNNTLNSASNAADSIAAAATQLPELAKRLDKLADTAESTIGAYGPNSPVNREVQAAIGDLRDAVKSIEALVQAIRRKPNSLLIGR
ncbi:intermembrane transport protein PqiB [Ruegeria sp. Ofav3-42]|uniref:PqiB family protein n=1 Tax=Ruegeria sp. Ofav3-42 TaxID=2917759 RepID=UPI001EF5AB82|nr:MlaD family protein [Ruegeria sp. Ofav3-42]MCG7518326.1 MlaD family protein [Ruegeria sp. Ofav3-42]